MKTLTICINNKTRYFDKLRLDGVRKRSVHCVNGTSENNI